MNDYGLRRKNYLIHYIMNELQERRFDIVTISNFKELAEEKSIAFAMKNLGIDCNNIFSAAVDSADMRVLSEENFAKIHEDDVFQHDIIYSMIPSYKRDEPYWSNNWIFTPVFYDDGTIDMVDTRDHNFRVPLLNNNVDEFKFLFNINDVRTVTVEEYIQYEDADHFHVPLGTEGWQFCKYYVRKNAKKNISKQMGLLKQQLREAETKVENLKLQIKELEKQERRELRRNSI